MTNTPKEEAEALIEMFYEKTAGQYHWEKLQNAKKCALICCDKIIEENHFIDNNHDIPVRIVDLLTRRIEFYNQVKQHLSK